MKLAGLIVIYQIFMICLFINNNEVHAKTLTVVASNKGYETRNIGKRSAQGVHDLGHGGNYSPECVQSKCKTKCDDLDDFVYPDDDAPFCNKCCQKPPECEQSKCKKKCDDPDDFVYPDDDAPFCNKCCPKPTYNPIHTNNQCCKYIDCDDECEDPEDFHGKNKDFCNDCCSQKGTYNSTTSLSKNEDCCKYINCYDKCEDDDDFNDENDDAYLCNQCCSHCKVEKEHNNGGYKSTPKPTYPVEGNHNTTTRTNNQCCKSRIVDKECCKYVNCQDKCDDYDDFVDDDDAEVCNTCCTEYKPTTIRTY